MHYSRLRTNDPSPDNHMGCTAIIDSIEKRWAKAEQEVFIAAVVLNPFIKVTPFSSQSDFLAPANILALLKRLYSRFFSVTEREDELKENMMQLYSNLDEYFKGTGICKNLVSWAEAVEEHAKHSRSSPDPISVYNGLWPPGRDSPPPPPLFKLAFHILSICPNSASCERLFSVFGNTLTKLRNRLGNQTLTSLAELKMHIRDEHIRDGETKARMKRFFGGASATSSAAPPSESAAVIPQLGLQAPDTFAPLEPHTSGTDNSDMDIDPVILQASDSTRTSLSSRNESSDANEFGSIVESFAKLVEGDEDDADVELSFHVSTEICQLFDFRRDHWVSLHERSATRSLDEELELYELLDLDAAGEADDSLEIDHTLDSILHM
jgi:hAT family C-terminal dimerisation region